MRRLEVEVIPRPVEIRRQQVDRVEPVLLPIRLRADEQRLLCDPVWRIRLLWVSVPQRGLAERHRRVLRVGADGADEYELARLTQARLLEHVEAHLEVCVPV